MKLFCLGTDGVKGEGGTYLALGLERLLAVVLGRPSCSRLQSLLLQLHLLVAEADCSRLACGGDESGRIFRPEKMLACVVVGVNEDLLKDVLEIQEFGRVVEFSENAWGSYA
eukprot:6185850-Pleurochrysis_carterae.AAC.1